MKSDPIDGTMGFGRADDSFGAAAAGASAEGGIVAPAEPVQPPPPPQKTVHRKPLWVFISVGAYTDNPEVTPVYQAYRCAGVEEVRKHLTDHKIDAADIDKRAIIFRADPVEVKIKTQLLIKF